ncbi:hypothetical protein AB0I28_11550 [Phytomonospora sp. NPDC050363]|uniref:hypothetical protein n=1 Tax=Phytomonospora sp. NPDC050363 TaxID=3155642 RepID=UPI0033DFAF55
MTTPSGGWNPYDGPSATPAPGQPYQPPPQPAPYQAPQPQPAPYQPDYSTAQLPQAGTDPTSAPPAWSATQPVTGPPAFGEPAQGLPPAGAKSGRSPLLPIVSGVGALFFIVSVILLVLLLNTNGKLDDTRADLSASETTVGERDTTIADLSGQVSDLEDDVEELNGLLDESGDDLEFQKEAKAAIEECLVEVESFLAAFADGDQDAAEKAIERTDKECGEAEAYR